MFTYSFIHSLVFSHESRALQEPEPSHVTGIALAHCILDKFLGVVCHCFPPPLDVHVVILPEFQLPRKFRDLLHATNLRHGIDGFTAPPKEGVLRILSC